MRIRIAIGLSLMLSACLDDFVRKGGDGRVVETKASSCVFLDPENQLHSVSACEYKKDYVVRKPGATLHYKKAAFQAQMREMIWRFMRGTSYSEPALAFANVHVWLAASLFTPEEVSFIAEVRASEGNFTLRLPLNTDDWEITGKTVAWLGAAIFPSRVAHRADVLILTPQPTVTAFVLHRFLDESEVLKATSATGQLLVREVSFDGTELRLRTEPFAATTVAKLLKQAPQGLHTLAAVQMQRAPAQDAYLARVFSFPLRAPKQALIPIVGYQK